MKLVKSLQSTEPEINEDLDGVPLDDEAEQNDILDRLSSVNDKPKFIPSKWEELDPEQVKAQAVTTVSKWDLFEEGKDVKEEVDEEGKEGLVDYDDEDIDGEPMEEDEEEKVSGGDEDRRRREMREVEVKVLAFQDELEKRGVVGGSVDLVREYREKLLRRVSVLLLIVCLIGIV